MCLQFSEGQEIKNIHFLNHTGQGQHWHLVPECRAGFAMLAYTWVRRASLPSQDWKDPCSPQAVQGWMCQMSLPGAGYLCYQEMHPAPNRNNRDGSGFKALAQTIKWHHSLKITESVQSKTKISQLLSPFRRISQMLNLVCLWWSLSRFSNPHFRIYVHIQ